MSYECTILACRGLYEKSTTTESDDSMKESDDSMKKTGIPAAPKVLIDHFFKTMSAGNVTEAYNQLITDASPLKIDQGALPRLQETSRAFLVAYGDIQSFEPVYENKAGECILNMAYAAKFECMIVIWLFTFYRPEGDEWFVVRVSLKD